VVDPLERLHPSQEISSYAQVVPRDVPFCQFCPLTSAATIRVFLALSKAEAAVAFPGLAYHLVLGAVDVETEPLPLDASCGGVTLGLFLSVFVPFFLVVLVL